MPTPMLMLTPMPMARLQTPTPLPTTREPPHRVPPLPLDPPRPSLRAPRHT
jgi:hypothetical protein